VDWFSTAEMLGPEEMKRLKELREKCRDRADVAEKGGEAIEISPPPRLKP
jgi:hypothetical protein